MSISEMVGDIKVAVSVAVATWSSGLATFLKWIPVDIGKLATLIGIILSVVLIYTHIRKNKQNNEKHRIEMKLLYKQLEKQLEE